MMTRTDYDMIADTIRSSVDILKEQALNTIGTNPYPTMLATIRVTTKDLCRKFVEANPKFNAERFTERAGF